MEEQNQPWVVNAVEAKNRTADAIYKKYKDIIEEFNKVIVEQCGNCKSFLYYTTKDKDLSAHLSYFYTILGYQVELNRKYEELNNRYELKIRW